MKVQFKFKAKATKKHQENVIRTLRQQGAAGVRQLFPEDENRELARLFIADVGDEAVQRRAIGLLKRSAAIEFAEPETVRKLIR